MASFLLKNTVLHCLNLWSSPSLVPVPVPSHNSVPRRTNQSQESKNANKIQRPLGFTKYIGSNLMWDSAVSCGTDQSHVGQTDQSHVGQTDQSHVGQTSLTWDRPVSRGTDQSHMEQTSLMWDIPVSRGTDKSHVGHTSPTWDITLMLDRLA